jgi:hypothetical protein
VLIEIKHLPVDDQVWILANFDVYGLKIESGRLVPLTGFPPEEFDRMIRTQEIYAQDVIVKRKSRPC